MDTTISQTQRHLKERRYGLDFKGCRAGYNDVSCDAGNITLVPVKGKEFLNQLCEYNFLKNDSASWI
jgi:hypothetical protein